VPLGEVEAVEIANMMPARCLPTVLVGLWSLLAALHTSAAGPVDPILFELEGRSYRMVDVPPKLRNFLARQQTQHYRERRELYDELIFDAFLEHEAKRTGMSRSALAKEYLAVPKPSDDDARTFYEANKGRIAQDFAAVKEGIAKALMTERIAEKKRAIVATLERTERVKLPFAQPLPPPVELVVDDFPSIGPADASITVVEFADFSCPLCQKASKVMYELLANHPAEVRWVFVHYPIGKKGIARRIHAGGQCLVEQELFWAYHNLVFKRIVEINSQDAPEIAAEVGADMERFNACYAGKTSDWAIKRGLELGRKHRVTRTPTLFVNGRPFASKRLREDLKALVENSTARL